NADESDSTTESRRQLAERAVKHGRPERTDHRRQSERDRHPERQPQIAHGQPEREPAKSPHGAPQPAPEQRAPGGTGKNMQQMVRLQAGDQPRREYPGEQASGDPEDFPGPPPDALVRNVEARRRYSAEPVKEDPQQRIGCRHRIPRVWTCTQSKSALPPWARVL